MEVRSQFKPAEGFTPKPADDFTLDELISLAENVSERLSQVLRGDGGVVSPSIDDMLRAGRTLHELVNALYVAAESAIGREMSTVEGLLTVAELRSRLAEFFAARSENGRSEAIGVRELHKRVFSCATTVTVPMLRSVLDELVKTPPAGMKLCRTTGGHYRVL